MPVTLEPFDPSRDFVVKAAAFRAGGQLWSRHQKFDPDSVSPRVLQQLYEQRRIGYPGDGGPKLSRSSKRIAGHCKDFISAVQAHMARVGQTLSPVEKHEQQIAAQQQDKQEEAGQQTSSADHGEGAPGQPETPSQESEGAPGTAREAPGAEVSAPATSDESRAPSEGEEASREPVSSPADTTANAEDLPDSPDADEAAAAPAGEPATAAADRDAKIEQLMIDHSQAQLLAMAEGLDGVNSRTPKAQLAAALVDADRA